MKTLRICGLALCAVIISLLCSCSSDDDDDNSIDQSVFYGTWECTSSTDTPESGGDAIDGYMVGETITIKDDGTYTSSNYRIGRQGTWSLKGNAITATMESGQSIKATISMVSSKMTWDGKANGYIFHYVFDKQEE